MREGPSGRVSPLLLCALLGACGIGDDVRLGIAAADAHPDGSAGGATSRTDAMPGTGGRASSDGGPSQRHDGGPSEPGEGGGGGGVPSRSCGVGSGIPERRCRLRPAGDLGIIVEKWRHTLPNGMLDGPPLVANLTDDNADGRIDTCDVPDVLVMSSFFPSLFMLSGATGQVTHSFSAPLDPRFTPAIGDLNGDGSPEIVAVTPDRNLIAFDRSGGTLWAKPALLLATCGGVGILDLEGDGRAEILLADSVYDFDGEIRFTGTLAPTDACPFTTASDLDGDRTLEVLMSSQAFTAAGVQIPLPTADPLSMMVAGNLTGDAALEIVGLGGGTLSVLDVPLGSSYPTGITCGTALPALWDIDGDGTLEIFLRTCEGLSAWTSLLGPLMNRWNQSFSSRDAPATVFDLKGTGAAVVIGGQAGTLQFYDAASGAVLASWNGVNATAGGEPIVVDVDADGSADILYKVTARDGTTMLMALSEAERRWAPTRRIWNQAAYRPDSVNEDGSIPVRSPLAPALPMPFRSNLPLENGSVCVP